MGREAVLIVSSFFSSPVSPPPCSGAQAWGQLALDDVQLQEYVSDGGVGIYTYVEAEFGRPQRGGAPLSRKRKAGAYAYSRASAFLGYLSFEGTVRAGGHQPLLVWTLALEALLLAATTPAAVRLANFFPKVREGGILKRVLPADCRTLPLLFFSKQTPVGRASITECMAALRSIWSEGFRAEPAVRRAFVRSVGLQQRIETLTVAAAGARQAFGFPNLHQFAEALAAEVPPAAPAEAAAAGAAGGVTAPAAALGTPGSTEDGRQLAAACARLVATFQAASPDLRYSRVIPQLVFAYTWFNLTFSHRVTAEQALSLTAAEGVARLPPRLRAEGEAVLGGLLYIWDVLQRALQVMGGRSRPLPPRSPTPSPAPSPPLPDVHRLPHEPRPCPVRHPCLPRAVQPAAPARPPQHGGRRQPRHHHAVSRAPAPATPHPVHQRLFSPPPQHARGAPAARRQCVPGL